MSAENSMVYRVVVNHEEQYSIWPADREIPKGWRDAGKSGLSLRKKMEGQEA